MLKVITPPVSHIVYQTCPQGIVTPCHFYAAKDKDVLAWARDMRADNPDHTYQVTRNYTD